jgi:hypothetical protein
MMEAAERIDSGEMLNSSKKINTDMKQTTHTLYVHWQYHPCDITKIAIRNAYDKTLMGIDGFHNMTVCFSRPQNLEDQLTGSDPKGEGGGNELNHKTRTQQSGTLIELCSATPTSTLHRYNATNTPDSEEF